MSKHRHIAHCQAMRRTNGASLWHGLIHKRERQGRFSPSTGREEGDGPDLRPQAPPRNWHCCRRWQPMFESRLQFSTGPAIPFASVTAKPRFDGVPLPCPFACTVTMARDTRISSPPVATSDYSCWAVRGSAICFFECSNPQSGHAWAGACAGTAGVEQFPPLRLH